MIKEFCKNLIRQINYMELSFQLDKGFMTEQEFEEELDKNPHKYEIVIKDKRVSEEEIKKVVEFTKEIGGLMELSVNETAMLFEVNFEQLQEYINRLEKMSIQ